MTERCIAAIDPGGAVGCNAIATHEDVRAGKRVGFFLCARHAAEVIASCEAAEAEGQKNIIRDWAPRPIEGG